MSEQPGDNGPAENGPTPTEEQPLAAMASRMLRRTQFVQRSVSPWSQQALANDIQANPMPLAPQSSARPAASGGTVMRRVQRAVEMGAAAAKPLTQVANRYLPPPPTPPDANGGSVQRTPAGTSGLPLTAELSTVQASPMPQARGTESSSDQPQIDTETGLEVNPETGNLQGMPEQLALVLARRRAQNPQNSVFDRLQRRSEEAAVRYAAGERPERLELNPGKPSIFDELAKKRQAPEQESGERRPGTMFEQLRRRSEESKQRTTNQPPVQPKRDTGVQPQRGRVPTPRPPVRSTTEIISDSALVDSRSTPTRRPGSTAKAATDKDGDPTPSAVQRQPQTFVPPEQPPKIETPPVQRATGPIVQRAPEPSPILDDEPNLAGDMPLAPSSPAAKSMKEAGTPQPAQSTSHESIPEYEQGTPPVPRVVHRSPEPSAPRPPVVARQVEEEEEPIQTKRELPLAPPPVVARKVEEEEPIQAKREAPVQRQLDEPTAKLGSQAEIPEFEQGTPLVPRVAQRSAAPQSPTAKDDLPLAPLPSITAPVQRKADSPPVVARQVEEEEEPIQAKRELPLVPPPVVARQVEEEEPIQTKRETPSRPIGRVQRESVPEEEEPIQTKRETPSRPIGRVQRESVPEEEEPIQTKREAASRPIGRVQRESVPEEEEPIQPKRETPSRPIGRVQRESVPEEDELQLKRERPVGQMQRDLPLAPPSVVARYPEEEEPIQPKREAAAQGTAAKPVRDMSSRIGARQQRSTTPIIQRSPETSSPAPTPKRDSKPSEMPLFTAIPMAQSGTETNGDNGSNSAPTALPLGVSAVPVRIQRAGGTPPTTTTVTPTQPSGSGSSTQTSSGGSQTDPRNVPTTTGTDDKKDEEKKLELNQAELEVLARRVFPVLKNMIAIERERRPNW